MNAVWTAARARWRNWMGVPIAAALTFAVANAQQIEHYFQPIQDSSALLSNPNGHGTISFTVAGGIRLANGKTLLNNMRDYHDPRCITLVINDQAVLPAASVKEMQGRTYKARVHTTSFNGHPQFEVEHMEPLSR